MTRPEINVTPLIDVLLVLLIIFMVVSPARPGRMETKIPSEPTEPPPLPNPDTLVVTISETGSLSVNADHVDGDINNTDGLTAALKDMFQQRAANLNTERTVFVKAPKGIGYGAVAKIVDAIGQSGAAPIGLQVDRLEP